MPKVSTKQAGKRGSKANRSARFADERISPSERRRIREAKIRCAEVFDEMDERLKTAEVEAVTNGTKVSRYVYHAELYRAVRSLASGKSMSAAEDDLCMALGTKSQYSYGRSIFSLAIQLHDVGKDKRTSKQNRSTIAGALEYARRHRISPETISSFLVDVGGVTRAAELARDLDAIHHYWLPVPTPPPSLLGT